ncbi:restriction endonuclease subunit S [Bifidobacterium adolescentis]|nr:restriction endonuclease subunit S [Bifidobacterium adolescentis]KAB5669268.1 restriction endonuclease subunit S [Bifidobacterium adolescentis]KAB5671280.1 restriction endonuclease subunit S [Bifidobacterium adolescentis]KAB5675403.1 restriction endonuclease subunit S [Bifidobacterium adolescentis]KAB5681529.1 restriction endonuclease subunit S [Bifidobacterium adolescentis]
MLVFVRLNLGTHLIGGLPDFRSELLLVHLSLLIAVPTKCAAPRATAHLSQEYRTPAWEQRKLGQHLKLSRELGHTGVDARKLTVKLWGKGVVEKTDLYGGSAQTQYYIRHAGQFMYGKLDFLHAAFGVVPDKLDCFESTLDSPAFDIEGLDSSFLLNLVTQEDFYLKNGNIANGSRKAKRIHEETFLNMEIRAPELVEQRRIGAFLDRLDSLITLHQRKYDGCANPLFLERRISCRKPSHQNRCSATTTPSG